MRIKSKIFTRRAFILGGIQLAISAIFSYRLYTLQIRDRQKYGVLSNSNRTRVATIMPQRGKILDRNGIELAVNKISYVIVFDGEKTLNRPLSKPIYGEKFLGEAQASTAEYSDVFKEHSSASTTKLPSEIEFRKRSIKEVSEEEVTAGENAVAFYKRYYPFGSICSHVLGYTKKQQTGVSGIEYIYDDILKGTPGKIEQEVNCKKRIIRELSNTPPQDGNDVQLTIDINLQKKIAEIFHNHKGAVTVLDIRSGEILALYNSPAYDNNLFTGTLPNDTWKSLNSSSLPLVNRALSYQTPLGSVFKVIVALAALKDGVITPKEKFLCKGHMKIGNRKFRCWKSDGHGYVSLNEAIASSCNVYFYHIGKKIDVDSLVEMASKFGIGSGPLIKKFKEEASGLLPHKSWREQRLYSQWQLGDTINLAIGQGYILATPLQLAVLAARLATGKEVMPYIEINKTQQNFTEIDVDHAHLTIIQNAMFDAVNSRVGTAYSTNLPKNIRIAGKTGTPEINSHDKSHKLFIAYGSSHYAISVFIEHGKAPRQDFLIAYKILNYTRLL